MLIAREMTAHRSLLIARSSQTSVVALFLGVLLQLATVCDSLGDQKIWDSCKVDYSVVTVATPSECHDVVTGSAVIVTDQKVTLSKPKFTLSRQGHLG